ncbi:hypothetical protein VCRA2110O2_30046 [Vibrio crassostreae]|nr:hypothetical protein VCRA2110O2_30046 [Vibrio crassostreae]
MVDFKGKSFSYSELSNLSGVSKTQLKRRYDAGWRDDDLVAPVKKHKTFDVDGKKLTLGQAAKALGIPYGTLKTRHANGLKGKALFSVADNRANQILFKGKHTSLAELSRRSGISWTELDRRYKAGKRDDELIAPVREAERFDVNGEQLTLMEASTVLDIPYSTIKGRHAQGLKGDDLFSTTHRLTGNKNGATKLDAQTALKVKEAAMSGGKTQTSIAKEYDVDPSHVSDIKNGNRWGDV